MLVDQHLDTVLIRQMTWKPGPMRDVAIAIAKFFVNRTEAFADEVPMPDAAVLHPNCVGSAWRLLGDGKGKAGVIQRMQSWRRSEKEPSKGRTVFLYRKISHGRLRTFLKANGADETPAEDSTMVEPNGQTLLV